MNDTSKKNLIFPLLTTVLGSFVTVFLFSPIANSLYDPQNKYVPVITPVLKFFSNLWIHFFNYPIPSWVLLTSVIIGLILMFILRKFKIESPLSKSPKFLYYKKDKFKNLTWRWEWTWLTPSNRTNGYWEIYELKPECELCKTIMGNKGPETPFICPECNHVNKDQEEIPYAYAMIKNKIKKNTFPIPFLNRLFG